MSTSTGTATNYLDLLDRLRTFLTTGLGAGNNWTTDRWTGGNELIVHGPGTGSEAIYLAISAYGNVGGDYYNWDVRGCTGYVSGNAYNAQPSVTQNHELLLWNSSIPYWFIANAGRVIVVAKVSTVYEIMYAGKFLPYGTPSQYPYPVFIGACHSTPNTRWSDTTRGHTFPVNPAGSTTDSNATAFLPDNSQKALSHITANGASGNDEAGVWPWRYRAASTTSEFTYLDNNPDGTYPILPAIICMESPSIAMLGELDGVAWVSGYSNAAENTVTVGADTYLVVQNTFRTSRDAYCAIKLA